MSVIKYESVFYLNTCCSVVSSELTCVSVLTGIANMTVNFPSASKHTNIKSPT